MRDAGPDALLACADRALYTAKNGGRNRSVRYGHAAGGVTLTAATKR